MRVQFKTAAIPTRAAKRYKSEYNLPEARARYITAFVLGYRDWHELHAQLGKGPVSPLDESLPAADRDARFAYQLSRLELLFPSKTAAEKDDLALTLFWWQPSAAHPQRQPQLQATAEYEAYAVRRMARVLEAEFGDKEPTLQEFVARARGLAAAEGVEFELEENAWTPEEMVEYGLTANDVPPPGEHHYDLRFTRRGKAVFDDVIYVACGPRPEERVLEFSQES